MKKIALIACALLQSLRCAGDSWETALAGILTTPPAEGLDGRIYCTAEDRALHALDGRTGREYWSYRPGRKLIDFTVVSPDGTIFVLTSRLDLVAVSPGGWERWRVRLDAPPLLPPAVDGHGILYLLTEENALISLDRLGRITDLRLLEKSYQGLYAYRDTLLLRTQEGFDILSINGEESGFVAVQPGTVVILEEGFWCGSDDGQWFRIDPGLLTLSPGEPPLGRPLLYPQAEVLITDDGRIVSGRNDWFMEAYRKGNDAYDSFYQPGANSSRTNGLRIPPGEASLQELPLRASLSYLLYDQRYLRQSLKEMESLSSYQDLLRQYPRYHQQLLELVTATERIAPYGEKSPPPLDDYSLYRVYRILSKWGDLRNRDALIRLCGIEESTAGLQVLMTGLGNIGLDPDGRSLTAVYEAARRNGGNEALYRSVLLSSLAIARYNGGRSMKAFLEILDHVSGRTRSRQNSDLIREIMKSLSR